MSQYQNKRRVRATQDSKGLNFSKFMLIIVYILLLIVFGYLSAIMRDVESYVYGFLIGLGFIILIYLSFKFVPNYYLKKG